MNLPNLSQPVQRYGNTSTVSIGVNPSGCSWGKKIECAAAIAACGATCALGPEVCVPCLASIGASSCLDCLL